MAQVVLAVDIGTSSVKALALDERGQVQARASADYPTHTPKPGWVEHDPHDYLSATQRCLHALADTLGDAYRVAGIGLAGHMSALIALDSNGKVLRPAFTIGDTRGSHEARWLHQHYGETIAHATGNTPLSAFVLPKLLWYRHHEPEHYRKTATILGAKDVVRYWLTGEKASEPTEAGNTLLLRDETRDWHHALMEKLELSSTLFPPMKESLEIAGALTRNAAEPCGLPKDTPVIAGLADMAASVLGCGMLDASRLAITLGTSGQITQLVDTPAAALRGRFTYHPHAVPGKRYLMASVMTGGLALKWLAEVVSSLSGKSNEETLERILEQAALAPPGARGLTFLPHLVGAGSPQFDPNATASILGLTRAHRGTELARAVLEGVAYNVRHCLELLADHHPLASETVVAGGGLQTALWRHIIRDVTKRPLTPLAHHHSGLLGTAFATGLGVGLYPDLESCVQRWVETHAAEAVDAEAAERYQGAYTRYLELLTHRS